MKSIAEELRGLAVEHDLPIVSATQTTRSGYGSTDIGLEDTSESLGLPATADLMFALITSEELEDLDQLVVKQLKNRYNDPTIFKKFVIGIDRSRMKLYDVEQEAQEELIEGDTLIDDDILYSRQSQRDKFQVLEMMEPFVQKQYDEYQANRTEKEIVSEKTLRDAIIKDLSFVSKMGVAEYTLYQKYQEIHLKYPSQTVQTLYGEETNFVNEDHLKLITETKNNIWFPNSYEDFEKLQPELVYTDSEKDRQSAGSLTEKWNCLRTMTHSQKNSSNIGCNLHYIVRDKVTGKYLGVICITGDFIDLTPRDEYIGWDREYKTNSGKLNNSAIGSSILPTQPLGFNYTGGKLMALLCCADEIQKQWEENYVIS